MAADRVAALYQPQLWNLLAKAPAHLGEELAENYRRMIYAASREAVDRLALISCASGNYAAKRSVAASRRQATNSSLSLRSLFPSGGRCARLTRWKGSMKSFAGGPKPRLRCPAKKPSCSCYSAFCAAAKCGCVAWWAGRISLLYRGRRLSNYSVNCSLTDGGRQLPFPPIDRHHQYSLVRNFSLNRATLQVVSCGALASLSGIAQIEFSRMESFIEHCLI